MGLRDNIKVLTNPNEISGHAVRTATPAPVNSPRSITAAGAKLSLKSPDEVNAYRNRVYTEWQNDAWAYYDAIGEIKYGFGMLASVMSRLRLYAALNLDPDSPPTPTIDYRRRIERQTEQEKEVDVKVEIKAPPGVTNEVMAFMEELVNDLFTGAGGSSGFLRAFALNTAVSGESYLVKIKGEWFIKSTHELVIDMDGKKILRKTRTAATGSGVTSGVLAGDLVLPSATPVYRLWKEHPRYSEEPESSMLGLREACDELITIQRMIRTIARSRMNAGILVLAEGLTVAGAPVTETVEEAEEDLDSVAATIYDNLTAPVVDETNSASVVPTILFAPDDLVGKSAEYVEINRKVDQWLAERCDRALDRVLQGLDMPKDFVTGLANVRYSNAKNIDESLYKSHIEPLALMLVDALRVVYFKPELKRRFPTLTKKELDTLYIWYDPSEIVTRSDPAESANKGHENMVISDDAWRRAHGFSDADAPSEKEIARRLLYKASLQPEQIGPLFREVLPHIVDEQRKSNMQESPVPMDEDAQKTLYGEVQVPPGKTSRNEIAPPPEAVDFSTETKPAVV